MQGNAPEIDISQMASILKMRHNHTPTTLLLGAKAGKLFRNQSFYEKLKPFNPSGQTAFDALSPEKQYQECYHILERLPLSPNDLHLILRASLHAPRIEPADLILAELIKGAFFNPLFTTNIDTVLERSLEMAQVSDFDIFQFQNQAGNIHHIPFEARWKVVKVFGDILRRNYVIKQRSEHIQQHVDLRQEIEIACKHHILMIGMDPVWDEHLFSYFVPQQGFSLWYVNDAPPPQNSYFSRLLNEKRAQFFINHEGTYESFFKILHWHITEDVPDIYTVLVIAELHLLELQFIEDTFTLLVNNQPLQPITLINFFGVHGIGKTSLLQEVKQRSGQKGIACALVDVGQPIRGIWQDLLNQLHGFQNVPPVLDLPESQLYTLALSALKEYLAQRPLVILLDSVDTQDTTKVTQIERLLGELLGNHNLLIIIASKQKISFSNKPALTRNLKLRQLKPFDRAGSGAYLSRIGRDLTAEDRERILELANGYPLAMTVMVQAILGDRLNLQTSEDLARLFSKLMHLVIDKKILASMDSEELDWCRALISLLSIPRRFNMTLLQELQEAFEPALASQNPLENWGRLLNQIPRKTGIMDWDDKRDGYTVAEPVRNLFFQRLRLEQPERFHTINTYLTTYNQSSARKGDMKAWREYLYHCTFIMSKQEITDTIRGMIEDIRAVSLDARLQLSEEVARDDELKEVLGDHFGFLTSLINEGLDTGG